MFSKGANAKSAKSRTSNAANCKMTITYIAGLCRAFRFIVQLTNVCLFWPSRVLRRCSKSSITTTTTTTIDGYVPFAFCLKFRTT